MEDKSVGSSLAPSVPVSSSRHVAWEAPTVLAEKSQDRSCGSIPAGTAGVRAWSPAPLPPACPRLPRGVP